MPPEIENFGEGEFEYLRDTVVELNEKRPTKEKILECLRAMKNGRSWGLDQIPMESLKYASSPDFLVDRLYDFFW